MAHCVGAACTACCSAPPDSGPGPAPCSLFSAVGMAHWVGSACGTGAEDCASGWPGVDSEEGSDMVPHVIRRIHEW